MPLKFGKLPARPGAITFKFGTYLDKSKLPPVPATFGHEVITQTWGVLNNDQCGDCVIAGACHETMLWLAAAGRDAVPFDDMTAIKNYREAQADQGYNIYNPADPLSDTGLDMEKAAAWRRTVGIVDASGTRHTIKAYANIDNVQDLATAAYFFGAAGLGIKVTDTCMDQFQNGEPWDGSDGKVVGGHYIPVVGRNSRGNLIVITWGRLQAITPAGIEKMMDEAIAYLSPEYLTAKGVSPEAFNETQLDADLAAL